MDRAMSLGAVPDDDEYIGGDTDAGAAAPHCKRSASRLQAVNGQLQTVTPTCHGSRASASQLGPSAARHAERGTVPSGAGSRDARRCTTSRGMTPRVHSPPPTTRAA
jgi:hypothetical protein